MHAMHVTCTCTRMPHARHMHAICTPYARQALEAPSPCTRYYVTKLMHLLGLLVRLLPSRAMDVFLSKLATGVPVFGGRAARGRVLHP